MRYLNLNERKVTRDCFYHFRDYIEEIVYGFQLIQISSPGKTQKRLHEMLVARCESLRTSDKYVEHILILNQFLFRFLYSSGELIANRLKDFENARTEIRLKNAVMLTFSIELITRCLHFRFIISAFS